MSKIINQLATIDVNDEVLNQLDLQNIYKSFSEKYRRLDDLKKFRTDYEKKSALMRWWHNDKLRDAQLDSVEMQAEFSKTIGQLMLLSILQSKRLAEQQTQLTEQQKKLQLQAKDISNQTATLQLQHHELAKQSDELKNLVRNYFALRGLTEEGAKKLIDIAHEVRSAKEGMLLEFEHYAESFETQLTQTVERLNVFSIESNARIQQAEEENLQAIKHAQQKMLDTLELNEVNQKRLLENTLQPLCERLATLTQDLNQAKTQLQHEYASTEEKIGTLASENNRQLSDHREQVQTLEQQTRLIAEQASNLANELRSTKSHMQNCVEKNQDLQHALNHSLSRQRFLTVGLSISLMGLLGVLVHLLKLV